MYWGKDAAPNRKIDLEELHYLEKLVDQQPGNLVVMAYQTDLAR